MGNWSSRYLINPAGTPDPNKEPSFDPMLGFPNGRKERGTFSLFLPFWKGMWFCLSVSLYRKESKKTFLFVSIRLTVRHKHYSHYIISVYIRSKVDNQLSLVMYWVNFLFFFTCSDDRHWEGDGCRKDPIARQRLLCTQIDRLQTMQTRSLAVDVSVLAWETCLSYLQIWWVSFLFELEGKFFRTKMNLRNFQGKFF